MNRRQFLAAGSLVIGAGCAVQTTTTPTGLTAVQGRKILPAFTLPDLDGKIVRSSDFIGNALILRFWATW